MAEPVLAGTSVADLLDEYIKEWVLNQTCMIAGNEQLAMIELVRSADLHAYYLHFFRSPELTADFAHKCSMIRIGLVPFLRILLPLIEQLGDGIPWQPSTEGRASWADNVLNDCGELTLLRRLASGERYGLVQCMAHSRNHVSIRILATDDDALDRADQVWLSNRTHESLRELQDDLSRQMLGWARDRIDQYVGIHRDHFIQYDSDIELLALYQRQVRCLLSGSPEADALPDHVRLGPFTFGEWKEIAVTGAARALLHISFATRLSTLNKGKLDLRNLLTIFVRHKDLRKVWSEQTGVECEKTLDQISDIFMMTFEHAEDYFVSQDSPLPYNIRFGRYFSLLPQFGYLNNICSFLAAQLKRKYRRDWDNAVNYREAKFQSDLYTLLPLPVYQRGRDNFVIQRPCGARDTDIDAVLYETSTKCLYLFQLKWFDIFEYNWKERQSKITNLLKANRWVDQVIAWHTSRSPEAIVSELGLERSSAKPLLDIRLIVLTRTAARFGGLHDFDKRAAWISWPQLCRIISENKDCIAPLELAWQTAGMKKDSKWEASSIPTTYDFPRLQIDVYR